MDWNKFAKDVHQVAVDKGWWDKPVSFDEVICECLVHLGRAYEEYRSGRPNLYYPCNAGGVCEADKTEGAMDCASRVISPEHPEIYCTAKSKTPHGTAVELGECVLLLLDYLASNNERIIPFERIGVWVDLTKVICDLCGELNEARNCNRMLQSASAEGHMHLCIEIIFEWAAQESVDLESILRELHKCEKARAGRREGEAQ